MEENSLQVYEEKIVDFYGDEIVSIQDETGRIWVPIIRPCENLGLHLETQRTKIQNDNSFSSTVKRLTAADGKTYEMVCLPLEEVQGWLFSINPSRIKDERKKARLILYRRECIKVLNDYWTKGVVINPRIVNELTEERIQDIVKSSVEQTLSYLIATNYLPREQQQNVFAKDVVLLRDTVSQLPSLTDRIQWYLTNYMDHYFGISPAIDIAKIVPALTVLTPELFKRLYAGERWSADKLMLLFPAELPTKKRLKEWCKECDLAVRKEAYSYSVALSNQLFREQHQYGLDMDSLILKYNKLPRLYIQRAIKQSAQDLQLVFDANKIAVPYGGYHQYIKSVPWYNKRNKFRSIFNVCWDCHKQLAPTNIVIHHLTYDRLGCENIEDLVTLCKECHMTRHPEKK